MARIPFRLIELEPQGSGSTEEFEIVDRSLRVRYAVGNKGVNLRIQPNNGYINIKRRRLSRIQHLLESAKKPELKYFYTDANDDRANFFNDGTSHSLSGTITSKERLREREFSSLNALKQTIKIETKSFLSDPGTSIKSGQLIPVDGPSPSPTPDPTPTPSDKGGSSGGGESTRSFLIIQDISNKEISFGGTATGAITLSGPISSISTFTRQGISETTTAPLGYGANDYSIALSSDSNSINASSYSSGNGIKVSGSESADTIIGSTDGDSLRGSGGDDIISGGQGNDTIFGNQGNDIISTGEGNDSVQAGQGDDQIDGGDGDDYLYGGTTGNDTILGGAGNDELLGDTGDDSITGGTGDDEITGGEGIDNLAGDDGNDIFYYTNEAQLENGSELVDSAIDGGANIDRISVNHGLNIANTVSFAKASSVEELYVIGTASSNIALDVTAQTAGINTVNISTANAASTVDVSEFTTTGVSITGGSGNDSLVGGDGKDTVTGGAGTDRLFGNDDNDLFLYTNDAQLRDDITVVGGDGIDTIQFTTAIDPLNTGNFNTDVTRVREVEQVELLGASKLNLGVEVATAGITTIITGSDNTELRYDNTALNTITVDTIQLDDDKTLSLTQFGPPGAGHYFNVINLKGDVNAAGLDGGISVTASNGTGFNIDVIGGNGSDTITGGEGSDAITGGNGTDTITGAAANDQLTGGNGADEFRWSTGDGIDAVTDFVVGTAGDQILNNNIGVGDVGAIVGAAAGAFGAGSITPDRAAVLTGAGAVIDVSGNAVDDLIAITAAFQSGGGNDAFVDGAVAFLVFQADTTGDGNANEVQVWQATGGPGGALAAVEQTQSLTNLAVGAGVNLQTTYAFTTENFGGF